MVPPARPSQSETETDGLHCTIFRKAERWHIELLTHLVLAVTRVMACGGCQSYNHSEFTDAASPSEMPDDASMLNDASSSDSPDAGLYDVVTVRADPCEELFDGLLARVEESASCTRAEDCMLADVDCLSGFGGCRLPTNMEFDVKIIGAYERAAYDMNCPDQAIGVCECPSAGLPKCLEGRCVQGERCGEYDLGERWTREDGLECYCDAHLGDRCRMCGEHYVDDQWTNADGCICLCTAEGVTTCVCP